MYKNQHAHAQLIKAVSVVKFPLAPLGVLTPLRSAPINTSGHKSAKSPLNIFPIPSEVIPKVLSNQIYHRVVGRGVPPFFVVVWNPNICVNKQPMQNFKTLGQTLPVPVEK